MDRIHDRAIGLVALHPGDDTTHHRNGLKRIVPGRRFRRQHHRIGAVIDRGGDVGRLRASRRRRGDHRFEHLGRYHHRLACLAAAPDHLLLDARHVLRRQFHAEIAARHHHPVGKREYFVQTLDGGGLFQLGHDGGPPADDLARRGDVVGTLHEAESDPVDAEGQGEFEIVAVLFGKGRDRQHDVRDVDPFMVAQPPAEQDFGDRMVRCPLANDEADSAVVDKEFGTFLDGFEHFGMRQRRPDAVARIERQVEAERLARFEIGLAALDRADP